MAADTGDVKTESWCRRYLHVVPRRIRGTGQERPRIHEHQAARLSTRVPIVAASTPIRFDAARFRSRGCNTLFNGLYGTYIADMEGSRRATSRRDVIAYIKTFSSRFATEKRRDAIVDSAGSRLQATRL